MTAKTPKAAPTYPRLSNFGEVLEGAEAAEPILAPELSEPLLAWLEEIWAAKLLAEVGLKPRTRAMFSGSPGTGKTTLAHHLAGRLGLPIVLVRPDRIVGMYLGETNKALGALFDAARPKGSGGEGPVILFFDEFEALGQTRREADSGGQREMNGVVSMLLQAIERHPGYIIAATNTPEQLDQALWRRFDFHLTFNPPAQRERELILERYLAPFGLPAEALSGLADACATASPALLRQLCEGLKRTLVLGKRLKWDISREATFTRVLGAIEPHPDLGKPRLWALGAADKAVGRLPWPLPLAEDLPALEALPTAAQAGAEAMARAVVSFPKSPSLRGHGGAS